MLTILLKKANFTIQNVDKGEVGSNFAHFYTHINVLIIYDVPVGYCCEDIPSTQYPSY